MTPEHKALLERAIAIIEAERECLFEGHQVGGVVRVDDDVDQIAVDAMAEMGAWLVDARAALSSSPTAQTGETVAVKPLEWPPRCPLGQRVHNRPALVNYTIAHYGGDVGEPVYRWAEAHSPWSEPLQSYEAAKAAAQADFERRILSALAHPVQPGWRPTHRHVKRGSEYMLLGIGKMQTSNWMDEQWSHEPQSGNPPQRTLDPVDMREVAIYRAEDGQLWVRPREEFEDGRFETIPAAPQPKGE